MGGTIIETESERVIKQSKAQMIVELGQEDGIEDNVILERLQNKAGLSLEKAKIYLATFGKQPVQYHEYWLIYTVMEYNLKFDQK